MNLIESYYSQYYSIDLNKYIYVRIGKISESESHVWYYQYQDKLVICYRCEYSKHITDTSINFKYYKPVLNNQDLYLGVKLGTPIVGLSMSTEKPINWDPDIDLKVPTCLNF